MYNFGVRFLNNTLIKKKYLRAGRPSPLGMTVWRDVIFITERNLFRPRKLKS